MISGLTIVRNAIKNGYIIQEVIWTLQQICDEVIVCDGYSDDGTHEYLQQQDIKLYQDDWNLKSNNGLEFARITNLGLDRCSGGYILYLQADEIIHEKDFDTIKELIKTETYNSIYFDFHHIRYNFDYELNEGYKQAIRIIKNKKTIRSCDDAYSFGGDTNPSYSPRINIYHYGYVFIKNILQKMINHHQYFYVDANNYKKRKELAEHYLSELENGKKLDPLEIQSILEPEYKLIKHNLETPKIMKRLEKCTEYTIEQT